MPSKASADNYQQLGRRAARKELVSAVLAQNLNLVSQFVQLRPDIVDARNSHGHTALSEAVTTDNLELVKLLVEAGADPKQCNHGGSSLIDAAAYIGSVPIAEYLKENGCFLTIHHAASLGYVNFIREQLDQNESLIYARGPRGETLMHNGAHGNHVEICSMLLDRNAEVDSMDRQGNTPLCHAVENNSVECAERLLIAGANPNQSAGYYGGTVLHRSIMHKSIPIAKLLLDHGADPNRQDVSGKTALHAAITSGKLEIVEAVLDKPIDLELKTRSTRLQPGNETALDYARRVNKKRILAFLEQRLA